ncbi:hypothetical protein WJX79_005705 [Trebouxia sp. C0005]
MLRRSLQNYAKVKAASSQASRDSSEYASCKENIPVVSDGNSMAVPQTASNQPGCDRTPISRLDQTKVAVLSSRSSKELAEVVLTPVSASGSVDSTRGTPVLFANKNSLSVLGSPALISRDQEQASHGENIKVVIRVRPLQCEGTASEECLRLSGSQAVTLLVGSDDTTFTFDHVLGPQTSQEQFFRVVGRPMVENVLSGYNSCIFAYGQTGSGKTHTMLGQLSPLASGDTMPEEAGLTPRIFAYLFACMETVQSKQKEGREVCFLCKCSFLEIYKEVITDLLNPTATRLHIREDLQQGVHVEGLLEQTVTSTQAVMRLLSDGAQNRHVAATKANADSSRSHCVFKCIVESKCTEDGVTSVKTSCLNLVDLAGSERQKVAEGEGERVKEAGSINRSLASLGLVIKKLVEGNGPGAPAAQQTHIPYRDSRLTFLLQDSLGGNAKTVMVANVSPAAACVKETHSTLGFAHRAKMIRNKAVVNEDTTADASLLQKENERLRKELEMFWQLQQACTPTPPRRESTPLAVAKVRQEAELAEAEVAAVWARQMAAALELNQDLEDNIIILRQQNASLKREREAMEEGVRQMQADMQALVEADLDAQQRAQAAEARAEAVTAQSRQQRSHPLHAEAQLEEAPASFGDAASMQDTSLMYSLTDAQLISQVASSKTQLQNGNTHAVELKKRLAESEAERDSLAVAAQQLQQAMQQQSLAMQNLERDHQASLQERDALTNKNGQIKAELQEAAMTIQQLQELAAKATAVDELNASMTQLRTELATSTAQQAQHEQDNTQQQAEFVGQVLQELQVLEAALVQKAEECESYAQQHASLKAQSDMQSEEYAAEHSAQASAAAQLQRDLDNQHAQHANLTEKLLALEAQVAYKQHKLDALQKDVSSTIFSRGALQADLSQSQQHGASQMLRLESNHAVELAEGRVHDLCSDHLATQEQLEQDRDSLMEEVLSAKARAADQERTVQSLRVAAEATAREKILLTNQLDSTEQQLAIQAQELLGQQRETQRLQAAQKDQAVHLKKAQLKGSSNEHGLRGLQQRLQEALQDKKSAELKVQDMQMRLQEAELAVSQAEHMGQHMCLGEQRLQPDGADRLGTVDDCQHGLQTLAGSVHRQHQSTQTSLQAEDGQEACCHIKHDAHSRAHYLLGLEHETSISGLQHQLTIQTAATLEAQAAAQRAQHAMDDRRLDCSQQLDLQANQMRDVQRELASTKTTLQAETHALQLQQTECCRLAQELSGLEQEAESTQLKQKNDRLGEQLDTQSKAHSATQSRLEKEAEDLTQQLRAQAEAHSAELSRISAVQARAQSRAEELLTELQAAQQSCQALVRQAGETEAREAALQGSLQDRDDLILDLDNQIKALEVQITGAFAEHEAKLGQQQEALARQSQKGLASMQTRINALQATLAADSAQHAAAYADLQHQNERLQRDKESAYGKVAAMQRQAQSSEGRALGAEQAVAALQQDVVNWQSRYKKKDCELASQTSKVAMMESLQQSAAEAQAGLAAAHSKAATASKALSQTQQELHQLHDAYRRRDGEVQRWKGLASQARAEGQSLQATRDEEAALYADQVQQIQEELSAAARSNSCSTSPLLHKQLAQLLQERDAILAHNHQLTGQLEVTAGEQHQEALLQQQHVAFTAEKVAAVQAVQQQLEQAKLEHAAVMSQLRALHSSALEEVRRLRLNQKA